MLKIHDNILYYEILSLHLRYLNIARAIKLVSASIVHIIIWFEGDQHRAVLFDFGNHKMNIRHTILKGRNV